MATHDNDERWKNADLTFEGRRSGMNTHCSDGEYIGFCVTPDETGFPVYCKVNISQADVFARSVLDAINTRTAIMADDQKDWGWYIGRDEEVYTSGPETYKGAVQIARDEYEGAHICEAYKAPVSLASFFDAHGWLEQCDEQAYEDYIGDNGDLLFDVTPEDREALQVAVRAAIEKWQSERKLIFMPFMFTETRNHEYISAPAETE